MQVIATQFSGATLPSTYRISMVGTVSSSATQESNVQSVYLTLLTSFSRPAGTCACVRSALRPTKRTLSVARSAELTSGRLLDTSDCLIFVSYMPTPFIIKLTLPKHFLYHNFRIGILKAQRCILHVAQPIKIT